MEGEPPRRQERQTERETKSGSTRFILPSVSGFLLVLVLANLADCSFSWWGKEVGHEIRQGGLAYPLLVSCPCGSERGLLPGMRLGLANQSHGSIYCTRCAEKRIRAGRFGRFFLSPSPSSFCEWSIGSELPPAPSPNPLTPENCGVPRHPVARFHPVAPSAGGAGGWEVGANAFCTASSNFSVANGFRR